MLNRKNIIASITFSILLAVAPTMAAKKESVTKGSGTFVVPQTLLVAGTEIQAGEYDVKWESSSSEATVQFRPVERGSEVKVQGKIEDVDKKFESNAVGISKDASGRKVLEELQFGGKKMKIVFD